MKEWTWAIFWSGVVFIGVSIAANLVGGCGAREPHIYLDDPDVCQTEGVEDCCPECGDTDASYNEGYNDGVESVMCPPPEVIVETETVVETEVVIETVYMCRRWTCKKKYGGSCGWDWYECAYAA